MERKWPVRLGGAAVLAFMTNAGLAQSVGFPTTNGLRLFGYFEQPHLNIHRFPKWTDVLARYDRERRDGTAACRVGACPGQQWKALLVALRGEASEAQLHKINAFVNRVPFRSDRSNFGVADYWQTPGEFFARGGDCEDYAIAKYFSLRHLNWDAEAVRLVVAMHEGRREIHALLAAPAAGTVMILDNLLPVPADHRTLRQYRPIYSINEHAWWFHSRGAAVVQISRAEQATIATSPCGAAAAALPLLAGLGLLEPAPARK